MNGAFTTADGRTLTYFNREIFESFDLRGDLSRITAPTVVITGADDFITGPVCAAELAAGIPGGETVVLPDTGHFIFVESPERFRSEMFRFLLDARR